MGARLDDIHDLYAYDAWASGRMLDAAARLSTEQLTREVGGSFPSVLATLAHILNANWVWLSRWQGVSPQGWPAEWPVTDYETLSVHWHRIARERDALLAGLAEADLERVVDYRNTRGEPFRSRMHEMLRHVVNHATYHRGQVTNHLRAVGGVPPSTDLILWYRERPQAVAAPPMHS